MRVFEAAREFKVDPEKMLTILRGMGARVTILDLSLERLRYLSDVMPPNVVLIHSNRHNILTEIADEGLQMTKIENRPTKGWLGDYVFLIDFEGHRQDERVAKMLARIDEASSQLKIFGSYPRFPLESLRAQLESVEPIGPG